MYQKRTNKETKESAVSPVVGVMLMLVVTIIIAAVVAVFASGIVTTKEVAPSGNFAVELTTEAIIIDVNALSNPVPSSELLITVSNAKGPLMTIQPGKTAENGTKLVYDARNLFGFKTALTGVDNNASGFKSGNPANEVDINSDKKSINQAGNASNFNQWFGNYTIIPGTTMSASDDAFNYLKYAIVSYTKSELIGDGGWDNETFADAFKTTGNTAPSGYGADDYLRISKGTYVGTQLQHYVKDVLSVGIDDDGKLTAATNFWYKPCDKVPSAEFGSTITAFMAKSLEEGDAVTVTITHIPSSEVILTKTVTVGGA